jgi:gamma-glutamyltranspeptidase/glutathione hydrolase
LLHDARADRRHAICGQGPSPAAATLDAFTALGLDLIPGTGLLCAVVPGAFDAWAVLLRDWGTWELADCMAYAIGYARQGCHVVPRISAQIETMRPLFEREWTTSAAVFMPGGNVPAPGSLLRRPALADTYERVLREAVGRNREARIDAARRAWYQGFVAEAVDGFFRSNDVLDVSGRRHRGLLTGQDMARWSAPVEAPLEYEYGEHTLLKCGPWSQGPVFPQMLALLRGFGIGAMDPVGADFVHVVAEAMKLAYADREAFYGDPDFVDVPMDALLSDAYARDRRALIGERASHELRPGTVPGYGNWVDREAPARAALLAGDAAGSGEPTVSRLGASSGDTCHIDVIDRHGNMVSATPSAGWLQSSPAIPELGFPLGSRGQMFWLKPGLPNSLAPGKRPRTTLSPSMALRGGKAWMAFGTPGGEQQDQWSAIMFLRMVHHRMTIQQAIDAPSFHSEHWPSSFWPRVARPGKLVLEGRFSDAVLADLRGRGHDASKGEDWSEGRLSGARLEADGQMFAGANPRGMQGYAVGR